MRLNNTELRIFEFITKKIEVRIKHINFITKSLVSTYLNKMIRAGFLEKIGNKFIISSNRFARILSNLLIDDPTLIEVLSNESIPILTAIINKENQTMDDISKEVDLSKSSLYPYIRKFLKRQIIYKENDKIVFNWDLWSNLYQFINLYKNHYVLNQFKKVPNNAKIYYESPYEIIFSLQIEFDEAPKTAFSVFDQYGIPLLEKEIFYRFDEIPRKNLDVKTILLDALRISSSSSDSSARRKIYTYLFYRKNINQLRKIKHPDLEILKKIVETKGKFSHKDFPSFIELKEKGEDYDIQI